MFRPWLDLLSCLLIHYSNPLRKVLSFPSFCNWGNRLGELRGPAQGHTAAQRGDSRPPAPRRMTPTLTQPAPGPAERRQCSVRCPPSSTAMAHTAAQVLAIPCFHPAVNRWGYSVMSPWALLLLQRPWQHSGWGYVVISPKPPISRASLMTGNKNGSRESVWNLCCPTVKN